MIACWNGHVQATTSDFGGKSHNLFPRSLILKHFHLFIVTSDLQRTFGSTCDREVKSLPFRVHRGLLDLGHIIQRRLRRHLTGHG